MARAKGKNVSDKIAPKNDVGTPPKPKHRLGANPNVQRRKFMRLTSGASLLALLPAGVRHAAWAAGSDAPEKTEVKVGFIPLTDCASVVIASVMKFDEKYGIKIVPSKEASWAAVRDKLVNGELDAAHVLYGVVYGVHLGIGGPKKDMAVLCVINTAVGVQRVPQDYLNVARVLNLSEWKIVTKILFPAVLPYMLTGVRLSIGVAWLVIVAAEMLTGGAGIGFWVWDEWNNLNVEHIIIAIFVVGIVGLLLEQFLLLLARRFHYD